MACGILVVSCGISVPPTRYSSPLKERQTSHWADIRLKIIDSEITEESDGYDRADGFLSGLHPLQAVTTRSDELSRRYHAVRGLLVVDALGRCQPFQRTTSLRGRILGGVADKRLMHHRSAGLRRLRNAWQQG